MGVRRVPFRLRLDAGMAKGRGPPLQSETTKKWLNRQRVSRRVLTVRNRNTSRNVRTAFDELLSAIENRRANAVVVADIAFFATSCSEARFFVKEVFEPMGVRFVDVANRFDSMKRDADEYLRGVVAEYDCERKLMAETERFKDGRLPRGSVPYGYVYDGDAKGFVRPDEEVALLRPPHFRARRSGKVVGREAHRAGEVAGMPRPPAP